MSHVFRSFNSCVELKSSRTASTVPLASNSSNFPASPLTNTLSKNTHHQADIMPDDLERLATDMVLPEAYNEPCELCGSLNIEHLISDHPPEGKLYSLDALIDAASRCEICDRLFKLDHLRGVITGTDRDYSVRVSFTIDQTISGGRRGVLTVWFNRMGRGHPFAQHTVLTNEGDVASTKHGLLTLQSMGVHTASPRSFRNAREWLDQCIDDHPGIRVQDLKHFRTVFGKPQSESQDVPARLIDVSACDAEGITKEPQGYCEWDSRDTPDGEYSRESSRIVDMAESVIVHGQYIALSYRWGSHPYEGYITTTKNLSARRENLIEHDLPTTFQDAIRIARSLGQRYLWIDAICIIQDSEEDWLQESSKMGSIFANSLLTLFAAAGEDSKAGMFNKRSTYGGKGIEHWKERVALCTTLPSSNVRSTLYIMDPGFSDEMFRRPHVEDGSLLSRAWCLQEDFLSARKLYYTDDQLYWHCDHTAISEDGLANSTIPTPSFFYCSMPGHMRDSQEDLHLTRVWYRNVIGYDYSKRDITKATDRLVAVAGLARHVATVAGSRYLAGLWEDSVLHGLLWWPSIQRRHKPYCAPSWSWASQVGQVEFHDIRRELDTMISDCEYVRADIGLRSEDEYGGVSRAALTLRSKVVELTLGTSSIGEKEARSLLTGGRRRPDFVATCRDVKGFAYLDEKTSPPDIKLFAIPITERLSLIVTGDTDPRSHHRVGLWEIYSGTYRWDVQDRKRWKEEVLPAIPLSEITIV
jgi:hypothetical protein